MFTVKLAAKCDSGILRKQADQDYYNTHLMLFINNLP